MFGQMKSRSRSVSCDGQCHTCKCSCHNTDGDSGMWIFILFCIAGLVFLCILAATTKTEPKTIKVNGRECNIVFVRTGQTSTGAVVGHDEIKCNWIK